MENVAGLRRLSSRPPTFPFVDVVAIGHENISRQVLGQWHLLWCLISRNALASGSRTPGKPGANARRLVGRPSVLSQRKCNWANAQRLVKSIAPFVGGSVSRCGLLSAVCLIAIGFCSLVALAEPPDLPTVPTEIDHVAIVDVVSGRIVRDQTIVIDGGRIQQVGAGSDVNRHEDAHPIDCTGLYAIPGLWDMHIHWYDRGSMNLFPVNGVCGVRVMSGIPFHHSWRKQFEVKSSLGPRMLIASAIVDGGAANLAQRGGSDS